MFGNKLQKYDFLKEEIKVCVCVCVFVFIDIYVCVYIFCIEYCVQYMVSNKLIKNRNIKNVFDEEFLWFFIMVQFCFSDLDRDEQGMLNKCFREYKVGEIS